MLKENNKKDKKDNGVKIASIEGAEVLKLQAGLEGEINYNSVFSNSLLLDKLKTMKGFNISKQGSTKDIINVKFSYGYTEEETADILEEIKGLKANTKVIKKDNNKSINRIKQLNKLIKSNNEAIEQAKIDIKTLTDKEEISKLQHKISTKQNKVINYENELKAINTEYEKDINSNITSILDLNKKAESKKHNKATIRDMLYEEGFSLDFHKTVKGVKEFDKTIDYVAWFRTGGKAKDGTIYFINKDLYEDIDKWQRMGIPLPAEDCKLVEMEIYKSLISSALIQENCYLTIDPDEILVMKDLKVESEEQDVISVFREETTGFSKAKHTKAKCENVIWDGACLLQKDDAIVLSEGFRGIRHHFYKTAGSVCDFQLYFKEYYKDDYENAYITDMFNRPVKVSSIKMLTTNNAMKWIKFLGDTKEAFEQWAEVVRENGCKFGLVKENHVSKYNDKCAMSFQMLQTLDITPSQLQEIFKDSLDYIYKLKNDDEFFIEYLKNTASTINKNELLADLATTYPTFKYSFLFKDARKKEVYEYKEKLKRGKLLSEAENLTLTPNPFLLMQYCTGQINDYINDGVITVNSKGEKLIDKMLPNKNSCCALRFEDEQKIGCFRSPHNSASNILSFQNYINEDMQKYFKYFGKNVIAINTLYNDVEARGNGADFDLDFVYSTINPIILEAVEKAQKLPTIVNDFALADKGKDRIIWNNTAKDRSKVDNILQNSQKAIGTSSNVAMLYLTQYWHKINEIESLKDNLNNSLGDVDYDYINYLKGKYDYLLDNVAILSILAQCSVDASKRRYSVGQGENGLNEEIERIRKELPFKEKPTFWQHTSSSFDNDEIEKKLKNKDKEAWKELNKKERSLEVKQEKQNMIENLYDYECPFNWLLKEIDKIEDANYTSRISDGNFIVLHGDKKTQYRNKANRITEIAEEFQKISNYLNANDDDEDNETNKYYTSLYKEYINKIKALSLNLDTMSLIIARALIVDSKFLKSNAKVKTKLLNALYEKDRDNFMQCFKNYEK